jgi:gamma-glutamyltranspeptidase/glutathione hydrolase
VVLAARSVVAAGHPATAAAAADVLAEGGNAVDAVIAATYAACVAEPVLASLGGGGFLMLRLAQGPDTDALQVYDFFTQTPRRRRSADDADVRLIHADFGPATQAFHIGLGTIATPGVLAGLFAAHADHGRMPMRRLVEPAVALARDGVIVSPFQAYLFQVIKAILESRPACAALFASPESEAGRLIGAGERLRLPELADAMEILAIEGCDLFYRGEMGRLLTRDCHDGGGHLDDDDLARYRVERRRPLAIDALGARLRLNPPPASGGLMVGFALSALPAAGLREAGFGSPIHLTRLAACLQATEQEQIPAELLAEPPATAERVLDAAALAAARRRVLAACDGAKPPPARSLLATRGTTHISVIDRTGMAAALSLSNGEASAYVLPGTGILLNNMLGEMDICPGAPNDWPEDRRMSSMMAPMLIVAPDWLVALGSGGSNRIRSALTQVALNLLVFGMALPDAIAAPRLHTYGERINIEPGFAADAVTALRPLARELEPWDSPNMFFGGVHAAMRTASGGSEGAGDARRDGATRLV